jgi:O-antigen ligase
MLIAWLMPGHFPPWTAFQNDLVSATGLLLLTLAVLTSPKPPQWPRLAVFCAAASVIPAVQGMSGRIAFSGDAWLAVLYLLAFSLAQVVGHTIMRPSHERRCGVVPWLGVVIVGIISTGLAIYQVLGISGLGIYASDMPPGGRAYANLAQPNMLASLLMLALIGGFALYSRALIGRASLIVVGLFIAVGLAATQSRTAWVTMGCLVAWVLRTKGRVPLQGVNAPLAVITTGYVALISLWPRIIEGLGLFGARTPLEQAQGGTRLIHWASMLDAIWREPWWGYGWNEVAMAQAAVAPDHPASAELIEHSHNLLLDLFIWNGIPLGSLLAATLVWWFWRHGRACRDAPVVWLLAGIGAVFVHAMVEYPLDYAYFLLPVGLMMGAVDALSPLHREWAVPRSVTAVIALGASVLLAKIVVEYLDVEQDYRQLAFESARIGGVRAAVLPPDPAILTQLGEQLRFNRTLARRGLDASRLESMRKVAARYGYPPVLLRYALAAGLNGQVGAAGAALARLCKLHPAARCIEGLDAWSDASKRYPELQLVILPSRPPPSSSGDH